MRPLPDRTRGRWSAPTLAGLPLLAAAVSFLTGCAAVDGALGGDPPIPLPSPAAAQPSAANPDSAAITPASPRPGATVDAAAQAKADAWLADARLPPGAVTVAEPPSGTTINDQWQDYWCTPMAEAEAYWKVPHMDLSHTAMWLSGHPSNRLTIVGAIDAPLDPEVTNAAVYDFPTATAFEGMTFNVASWGRSGSVIHLQIGVLARDSACATAAPGAGLMTAGG